MLVFSTNAKIRRFLQCNSSISLTGTYEHGNALRKYYGAWKTATPNNYADCATLASFADALRPATQHSLNSARRSYFFMIWSCAGKKLLLPATVQFSIVHIRLHCSEFASNNSVYYGTFFIQRGAQSDSARSNKTEDAVEAFSCLKHKFLKK